ncbi:hypothetical protein SERLA73DRAFT_74199 [Serpula lacrymans var. lacrymans S7.3]|uniref:Uncharacterized protein n=2 Tax=Serpula lacrymans var. lacrymans TaxID=341189 RepID=F8Q0W8_SERL3|nr:uncharacterized protein SERLADRAFT_438847 [Serpula lacrymans var. lacrymans S7.9]EGN97946.1 hypothetical protein SERLA73DRAFT_74199 [Serpula lacrymans var. lacrymans S7.3]EGO23534.1 hypothetical protein SERLADRAFT_438847 [Serpula lacrymans var. lacrymans S7.9]
MASTSVVSSPVTQLTSKIQWNTIVGIILGLVCFLSMIFFLHRVQQTGMGLTWILRVFRPFRDLASLRPPAAQSVTRRRRRRQRRGTWVDTLPVTLRPTFEPSPPPYAMADPRPSVFLEDAQRGVTTSRT